MTHVQAPLSPTELQIVRQLATGATNLDIARTLGYSEGTIKQYLQALLSKLGARNRVHAVARAIAIGLIPADSALFEFEWTPDPDTPLVEDLSPREQDVLRLVGRGATNRLIAGALGIEETTVKRHLSNALGKLGARDRHEAAAMARHGGML